jgi:hypothetical protein
VEEIEENPSQTKNSPPVLINLDSTLKEIKESQSLSSESIRNVFSTSNNNQAETDRIIFCTTGFIPDMVVHEFPYKECL